MFNPHTSSGSWGGGWVRSLSPLPPSGTRSSLPSPALLPPTWEARLLSEDARGSPAPTETKCRCLHHLSMWPLPKVLLVPRVLQKERGKDKSLAQKAGGWERLSMVLSQLP